MSVDEIKYNFFEFAETPAHFKRVINSLRLGKLRDELLDPFLHGHLSLAFLVIY
jgi:hypothetical protein